MLSPVLLKTYTLAPNQRIRRSSPDNPNDNAPLNTGFFNLHELTFAPITPLPTASRIAVAAKPAIELHTESDALTSHLTNFFMPLSKPLVPKNVKVE